MPNESTGNIQPRLRRCSLLVFATLMAASAGAAAPPTSSSDSPTPDSKLVSIGQLPPGLAIAASEPQHEQAIVITGSRIPRPNLTAVSPLTVIGRDEVKLEGAVLTESLVNALPQVRPDQGAFISNGATGTATVDLRGFGAGRTLVLINGRRLLPGDATYPAADINFIPSALIKRVEVLTGGASSVYGSDAVAGVVNFILETRLDGLRLDGQASFYQHNNRNGSGIRTPLEESGFPFPRGNTVDGGIRDINAAYGLRFAGERGHVTIYGGYRELSGITQDSRDYSACTLQVDDPAEPAFCGGSFSSAVGSFFTNFANNPRRGFRVTADRTFVRGLQRFNFAPYNYFQRPGRRYTAGVFAEVVLQPTLKPYVELMFMDDRTIAQVAPSGDFQNTRSINCDNPLLSEQQLSKVCIPGNFIGETPIFDDDGNFVGIAGSPIPFIDPATGATYYRGRLIVSRRNVEGGPRQEILSHRDLRALGGLKGELAEGLSYDASYMFSRVRQRTVHTNDLLITNLVRALDVVTDPATGEPVCRSVLTGADPACLPWDVFKLGGVTTEAAAYLAVPSTLAGSVEQRVANAFMTAELGGWGIRSPWAQQGAALSLGAEYRKDHLKLEPDEHYLNADLSGLGTPVLPLSGATQVKELFGETRIPLLAGRLIEDFTFEGGYRHSWYTNRENRFSTSSYKLALELTPIRGIRFRASQQRAVRAPNVQELFAPVVQSGINTDPCAGLTPEASAQQCSLTGVTASQYGNILQNPLEQIEGYHAIAGGNSALQPERATTRAIGVVLQPRFLPSFSATVDWFDIRLTGAIGAIGGQRIMDTCIATGDPFFCSRVHRDAEGSLWLTDDGYVDDRNANIAAFRTSGIDVASTYTQRLGRMGSANLEFNGTWTHRYFIDPGGLATPYDCAGLYGQFCGFPLPRWRHNARATWISRGGISLSLLWRHIGPVSLDSSTGRPVFAAEFHPSATRIASQDFFDLTALFQVKGRYSLRLGVRNVLDREPPLIASGRTGPCGGGGCNGNTYPQLYDPLGRYMFAGVTIDLKPL